MWKKSGDATDGRTNAPTSSTADLEAAEDQTQTHLGEIISHPTGQRGSDLDPIGSVGGMTDEGDEEILFNIFGKYLEVSLRRPGECLCGADKLVHKFVFVGTAVGLAKVIKG